MQKIWKIYQKIKEKAGIKEVNPENVSKIKELLCSISLNEMAKNHGMNRPRYLKELIYYPLINPTEKQKMILYYLFKKSRPPTSLRAIQKKLNLCSPYSCPAFFSLKILEDMGLVKTKKIWKRGQRYSIIGINRELFKSYWPDVESWGSIKQEKEKITRKRANKPRIQMERAFQIISEELKEKREIFTPEVIELVRKIIKNLNRGDFRERGWQITARSLSNLRRRLLKMPESKLISYLKSEAKKIGLFLIYNRGNFF